MAYLQSITNFVPFLADNLGFSEASMRMLLTPLIGLPLAYIHRTYLYNKSATTKHLYTIWWGLSLAYFNYGLDIKHSAFTVLLNYLLLNIIGGTQVSVALSFGLNMGYLLTSYGLYASDDYDMTWTTPQCILTLRMIGLAFDIYDGHKPVDKLSSDQKTSCIAKVPSFIEMVAYTYFYGGYFVGPQFPMRRYLDHVHGRLMSDSDDRPPQCVQASLVSFKWGVFYSLVVALIVPFYPNSFLFSSDFTDASFLYKIYIVAIWGHIAFVKYCCIFSLFDAVCVMTGMTYNGKDEAGNALWDTCIGAKAWDWEVSLTMKDVIASMNISTNMWAGKYLYKRLKFLGNRYISQLCTMIFLAMWHGWYVGYYITFAFEMAVINFEQQMTYVINKIPILRKLSESENLKVPMYILRKMWQLEYLGYPLISFTFLRWRHIKVVHGALFYYPYFLFFGWPVIYYAVVLPILKSKERKERKAAKTNMVGGESNGSNGNNHTKED
ncbi:lysophospholipid acyltransferase 5-like [Amphiura filiformis]|uniref:lysophospholipid acyltransferase 5-like n=1 Tax=Amphiura filiformis TaxID=82378 RepID=UPI003B219CC8